MMVALMRMVVVLLLKMGIMSTMGLPAMASLGSMGMISSALVIFFLIGVSEMRHLRSKGMWH